MKEKIQNTTEERVKKAVLIGLFILGGYGIFEFANDLARKQDAQLDKLCGEDRSRCTSETVCILDPFSPSATCFDEISTITPNRERK